jgi:hypothetical protein
MLLLDVLALAPFAHERVERAMQRRRADARRAQRRRSPITERRRVGAETRESVGRPKARAGVRTAP